MWRFDARCRSLGVAPYNVYRLALVSLIVARKLEVETQLPMSAWNRLSGSFYGERALCVLEMQFLDVLNYDVLVRADDLRAFLARPDVRQSLRAVCWGRAVSWSPREPSDPSDYGERNERYERSEPSDSPRPPRASPPPPTTRT